jgi:Txe/YoeB family toxin of toxin-antitoxin system
MSYQVKYQKSVKEDLRKIKYSNLKSSFDEVVAQLKQNPYAPTQSFEKLQPYSAGRYSRRLNSQHRVVYRVDEEHQIVKIYSAWSHYE